MIVADDRNYVSEVKPFAQSSRSDKDGNIRTYRYPTEGENPTPFYENLRATLPGVRYYGMRKTQLIEAGLERVPRSTFYRGRTRDSMGM
jgi:hypothetical protein